MEYVVYNIKSTMIVKTYTNKSAAKRYRTRLNNACGEHRYEWYDRENYERVVVKTIKVKNLISGEMVEIASNTPWSCRPDTESYWCN